MLEEERKEKLAGMFSGLRKFTSGVFRKSRPTAQGFHEAGGAAAGLTGDTAKQYARSSRGISPKDILVLGTALAAAGAIGKAGDKLVDTIANPIDKAMSFRKVMKDNPDLKQQDPVFIKKYFNTLHRFNPAVAGDPFVAGSILKRALHFKDEGMQPAELKTLVDIHKAHQHGKEDRLFTKAFGDVGLLSSKEALAPV